MKRFIVTLLFLLFALPVFPVGGSGWDSQVESGVLRARKFNITYVDLTTAGTSEDEVLFTIPAGGLVMDVYVYIRTAFTGGSVSAMTIAIGDTDEDALAEQHDVYGAGNSVWILEGQQGTDKGDDLYDDTNKRTNRIYTSATALIAEFTSTSDNLDNLTTGSLDVYIIYLSVE